MNSGRRVWLDEDGLARIHWGHDPLVTEADVRWAVRKRRPWGPRAVLVTASGRVQISDEAKRYTVRPDVAAITLGVGYVVPDYLTCLLVELYDKVFRPPYPVFARTDYDRARAKLLAILAGVARL